MLLMFIVWLVSVLSNIKLFVSEYTVWFVVLAVLMYILSKMNYFLVLSTKRGAIEYSRIPDRSEVQLKNAIYRDSAMVIDIGTYQIDKYSDYCYLGDKSIRVSVGELMLAIKGVEPSNDWSAHIPYIHQTKAAMYLCIGMITASVLLPSDNAMKYMAGAYLVQQAYDSEIVQTAAPLAKQAVINQLKTWAADNPDIEQLVNQAKELQHGKVN